MKRRVRIGTRGSQLALVQTEMVIKELKTMYPNVVFEKIVLSTKGDKIIDKPLIEFGGKGVFIEEFERALQDNRIDIAVHSGKDLPAELGEDLIIGGVLQREDPRDVLVVKKGCSVLKRNDKSDLGDGRGQEGKSHTISIGTGSLRRRLFAEQIWDCTCVGMRGNVPTRLEKMNSGICDGVILAAAGLRRLQLTQVPEYDYYYLSEQECIPAGCQGIIAAECRREDNEIRQMLQKIHHIQTGIQFEVERTVLKLLNADCRQMAAVYACMEESKSQQISLNIAFEKNGTYYRTASKESMENWRSLAGAAVTKLEDSPWYI